MGRRGAGCSPPLLLLLLLLLVGGAAAAPPLCNVSLERDPQLRWLPALRHFEPAFLRAALRRVIHETVPKWVHAVIQPIAAELEYFIPQPFAGEILGMCQALGISVGDGILINLAYESTAFCTSIIAQDLKGNIYHGRNLDYAFGDILQKITIDVQFMRNGQVAYKGTTFFGYVGLWTGQSPHKFTISGDERAVLQIFVQHVSFFVDLEYNKLYRERKISKRFPLEAVSHLDKGSWWENAIAAFLNRNLPVSWLVRDTLDTAADFQAAVLKLAATPIIADVYYIVGGTWPKEGVVITRNRRGPADIWPLEPTAGAWFRVETNYDHWTTPPPFDDRRTAAIKALNATGQKNINFETLLKVLSVRPVLNNYTVYTTVMSAAVPDKYLTWIRTLD